METVIYPRNERAIFVGSPISFGKFLIVGDIGAELTTGKS